MPEKRTRLSADVRKEQILDTASALFIERGFENVQPADIASELGISRPNIYTYFPSTEALLDALLDRATVEYIADLDRALTENPTFTVADTLQLLLEHKELLLLLNSGSGVLLKKQWDRVTATMDSHTTRFLEKLIGPDQQENFAVLRFLQRNLVLSAAYAIAAGAVDFDPKVVGGMMHAMLEAGYEKFTPQVSAHWKGLAKS